MRQRLLSPWGILACFMAVYIVLFGWLALARHSTFNTHALDLGYTVNTVWNTAHGRPFYFSTYQQAEFELDIPLEEIEQVDNLLSYHVEPLLGPIALLYRLWEDPRLLLMLQTIVIALGALPVYGLARLRLCHDDAPGSPICAYTVLIFPLIYLLAPSIEAANLSDFHAVALSPTFLLAAFYFLERDRLRWAFLFALLALLCKEEISLLVTMLGLYAALFRRRWILGMTLAAVGVGWFLLCVQVILPHFNGLPGSAFLVRYEQFGESLGEVAGNLLRQPAIFRNWLKRPEVLDYFKVLLGSVGWLALLAPELLALAGPVLAANAFSSYPWMRSVGGHYSASITAFLVVAAIYGTERLGRGLVWSWRRIRGTEQGDNMPQRVWLGAAVAILAVAGLTHHRYGISPLSRRFRVPEITAHHRLGRQILALVPPDVPLSVQSSFYPHLANRRQAYLFPTVADAEYVLLDVTAETYPTTLASQHGRVEDLIYSSQFGILAANDGFLLLQRGLTDAYEFPEDFFSFARTAGPESDIPQHLRADFGELELLGYDVVEQSVITASAPPVVIETYWRTARTPGLAYHVVPYFVGEDGVIAWVYGHGTPTALYYPTYTWQPGEIVRVTFPPHETAGLREVYLGVVRWGGELFRVDDRLPVLSAESNVIEDNTLVRLADLP
jgi:uncharacterized membrane protein